MNDEDTPEPFEPDDSDPLQQGDPYQHLPDAAKPPEERVLTRDQIKRRVKARHGIEPDEIDTLYPDTDQGNKDLTEFYTGTVLKLSSLTGTESDSKDPVDTYKLSKAEKVALQDLELAEKRKERALKERKKIVKDAVKSAKKILKDPKVKEVVEQHEEQVEEAKQKAAFEKAGEHLPPEDRVSFEEARASMRELMAGKKSKVKKKAK